MTAIKEGDTCISCRNLFELYERTPKSGRDYWLMTELFCDLHDGKDYCPDPAKNPASVTFPIHNVSVVPGSCSECGGTGGIMKEITVACTTGLYKEWKVYTCPVCNGAGRKL
jgi:hypothetical protein